MTIANISNEILDAGAIVKAYYDANSNGIVDLGDVPIGTSTIANAIAANSSVDETITFIAAPNQACNLLLTINQLDNTCICDTDTTPLYFNVLEGIANNADYTYSWTPATNLSDATIAQPTFVGGSTETFTLTILRNGGCIATDTVTVTVNPAADAGTLSGTQSICLGDSSTFTSTGTSNGTWTSSDDTIATVDANGVITSVAGGTATISYTVTQGTCSDASTLDITIIAPANAGTLTGNQDLCLGDSTTITSDGDAGGTWTSSDTTIATVDANGVVTSVAVGTAIISYTVTGISPCSVNTTSTLSLTVNNLPNAGVLSGANSLCLGSATTLVSDGDAGGTWTSSDTAVATVDNTGSVTALNIGTVTISYEVSGNGICTNDISTNDITIVAPNDPGTDTSTNATCNSIDLLALLGTTNTTGTWSPTLASGTNVFEPSVDPSGLYTYTIVGTAPCGNVSATVLVTNDWPTEDCDNDGVLNGLEFNGDTDGDGIVDYLDNDDDDDGILTIEEDSNQNGDWFDDDCDSIPNYLDPNPCNLIANGFTPNGDGDNDLFIIPAVSGYPNFKITIFNRWGGVIYEYANNGAANPQWWDGTYKDKKVPAGTYYYIIDFNQDDLDPIQGWVYVNY